MSLACETEIGVQNELALRFTIVSKPTPVLEYIKTISSLVGASHILAVFEEHETLKVFFDEKRLIDVLIRRGIHVMGHHVKVDYVVPPGVKVVISNIDPVVTNIDLMRLLVLHGAIVSPIICPPISDDMEYCHISYGVRYCYMIINEPLPNKLEFKYGDQLCMVKIRVENEVLTSVPFIKTDYECDLIDTDLVVNESAAEPSIDVDEENASPVVVSVESAVSDFNTDVHLGVAKLPIKRNYIKRKGRSQHSLIIKRTRVTATTRAAKKIKNNVKQKWTGRKGIKTFKSKKKGGKLLKLLKKSPPKLPSLSPTSLSDIDDALPPPLLKSSFTESDFSLGPLNKEKLLEFIDECKHNRAPIELAKKYLGSDCYDSVIHSFIDQIDRHGKNSTSHNLKLRLVRLCKMLTEAVNASEYKV